MGKIKIIIVLFSLLTVISLHSEAAGFSFKEQKRNKTIKLPDETQQVDYYINKALNYSQYSKKVDYIKAHIDTAELICVEEKIEFPSSLHLARAEYFYLISDYRSASQDATLALKKSKNSGETEIEAKTLNFFGRYCLRTGFFQEGIDYFSESIDLAKKNKIKGIIPKSYHGIADVYNALNNQSEYRNNLRLFINEAEIENDTIAMASGLFRLGTSLTEKERDFEEADTLLRKCLEIAKFRKDTSFITLALANMGWNYYNEKKYETAIEFYKNALSYSLPAKIYENAANAYGNIGTIFRDMGETEKSIYYYQKGIEQAKLGNDLYSLSWIYKDMSEMYLRKKDTSNAYLNFVLFKKYDDEHIKKANIEGLTEARIKYEADAHNKELLVLSLRLRNHKLLIYGYTGLFILSLAILLLLLNRAKINAKRRISEMNRQISEITQANLRQQMNPHFIFNTLNSIQYYMYQHDKLATNNYLTKFSSLMRKVLENSQHTAVPLRDELDALNLYLELEMIRFRDKFSYSINVDDEIDTLLYKVPTMLIQPYVENSICHGLMPGDIKGTLKIDLLLENEYISCIIEDNGIGREAALEKRKKSEKNHNSLGTQIVTSRLDLVNALYGTSLKTIYTDLKNDKGEPVGTRVEIQIPILT
jgi:tetratricopeptide (TPR) repeat protein